MSGSRYTSTYSSSRRRSRSPVRHKDQRNSHSHSKHNENRHYSRQRDYQEKSNRAESNVKYEPSMKSESVVRSESTHTSAEYEDNSHDYALNKGKQYTEHEDYRRRGHYFERKQEELLPPNINVVLRNLPDRAREIDIQHQLLSMGASIDEVSLIKDRETGESRKFAFVRFTSVGHAIQFVERYRTFEMDSFFVRVDYSKKTNQAEDKEEWRCAACGYLNAGNRRNCVGCRQPFSAPEQPTYPEEPIEINDGSKDISDTPTRMVLLRQLDHLSTEESIFNSVELLQGAYRTMLIRDKLTKMSCEFAFVEFIDISSASLFLEYARELLEIDGKKVLVSFANQDCFIPVYGQSEYAIAADTYEGLWSYWDKNLYASEYSLAIAEERKRKEEEAKRREEELKKVKEEEKKKEQQKKENLANDFSAFLAEMDALETETDKKSDIFAVPRY